MKDPKTVKDKNETQDGENLEGYPSYPKNQDIYNQFKEEQDIDPEDPTHLKDPEIDTSEEVEELDFTKDFIPTDLDIPGADEDDEQEEIGNEDEENNFYSIGGDNHHDLEEDQNDIEID